MAIQVQYPDPNNDGTLSAAYLRIDALTLDIRERTIYVRYDIFSTATARNAGKEPIAKNRSAIFSAVQLPLIEGALGTALDWNAYFGNAARASADIVNLAYRALKASYPLFGAGTDV